VSFFDDDEDAIDQEPRRPARSNAGRAGASPGGRSGSRSPRSGPPRRGSDPAIERRRWVAVAVVVVVVILMILLISSCQARNTKNSLEDYNNSVSQLISESDTTGATVFKDLSSGQGGSTISGALATPLHSAQAELKTAQGLGVPGQMAEAQHNVVLALRMRVDGIKQIATNVTAATSGAGSQATQAVAAIAAGTARFYASDVLYIDYAARDIAGALHGDSIAVGGSGVTINHGQFLTDLGWLTEPFIETELGASVTSGGTTTSASDASKDASATCASGSQCVHGSIISSVAVGSNTMSTAATNSVAGSPAPTFSLSFSNGGGYDEYGIGCKVSIVGGPSGTGVVSGVTTPGQTAICTVKLSSSVPAGAYTVTATIEKVPGETVVSDNTETFQVQFS
jgi:hypothetical protein